MSKRHITKRFRATNEAGSEVEIVQFYVEAAIAGSLETQRLYHLRTVDERIVTPVSKGVYEIEGVTYRSDDPQAI